MSNVLRWTHDHAAAVSLFSVGTLALITLLLVQALV